ncbi:hypothetical protein, partial [Methylobacterium oryzihabitans]
MADSAYQTPAHASAPRMTTGPLRDLLANLARTDARAEPEPRAEAALRAEAAEPRTPSRFAEFRRAAE